MLRFKIKPKLSLVLLAVSLLLIFFHYFGILAPIEDFFVRVLGPVQHLVYSLTGKFSPGQLNDNAERIRKLIVENEQLKVKVLECESLKKQLEILQTRDFSYVIGKVVSRDITSGFQGLIINVGQDQGIKIGFPVVVEGGILIGKVIEVKNNFSKVILLTDNHTQTAAAISGAAHTIGVVSGEHGLNMKMELIPRDEEVAAGEVVITSGIEPNIPKGLVIGEIAEIIEPGGGFFKTAYLKSLISLAEVSVVSILIPGYGE